MLMMVTSAVCWGSWANTYKLTKGYRFELFYWDYAFGIVLISLVLALTMGGREGFIDNVLLVAGIEMAGLAIAFPLAIGIALVEGVVLSYVLQPKGNPLLLSIGVGLAILAVIADGKAYGSLTAGRSAIATYQRLTFGYWFMSIVCHSKREIHGQMAMSAME